jgi:hypothetical protein
MIRKGRLDLRQSGTFRAVLLRDDNPTDIVFIDFGSISVIFYIAFILMSILGVTDVVRTECGLEPLPATASTVVEIEGGLSRSLHWPKGIQPLNVSADKKVLLQEFEDTERSLICQGAFITTSGNTLFNVDGNSSFSRPILKPWAALFLFPAYKRRSRKRASKRRSSAR